MITRKKLITSKEYWLVQLQNALYEQVETYLAENSMSKTEFAKKLGVSKGYVSQILNGDFDHKISKLIEISLAIDKIPLVQFKDVEEYVYLDSIGERESARESKINMEASFKYSTLLTFAHRHPGEKVYFKEATTAFYVNADKPRKVSVTDEPESVYKFSDLQTIE